jgi:hypothetical protein
MWDCIVLGEIPGTNIQVSFEMWLMAVTALLAAVLLWRELRTKRVRSYLLISFASLTAKYNEQMLTRLRTLA